MPALKAPAPARSAFAVAWVIVLVIALWLVRAQPWRSAIVVLIGAVLAGIVRILGEQQLGWRG